MRILLFGATGSAGGGVLEACIGASIVEEVRAITRRPLMHTSSKLRTFVHKDFMNYATVEEAFHGVDACLFCLGVSATQVSREEYRKITYSYTLAAAQMFKAKSPGAAFHYISGQGTRADPDVLVPREGANRARPDGTCGRGLLAARVHRYAAFSQHAENLQGGLPAVARPQALPQPLRFRRRPGPRHASGHAGKSAQAHHRKQGDPANCGAGGFLVLWRAVACHRF